MKRKTRAVDFFPHLVCEEHNGHGVAVGEHNLLVHVVEPLGGDGFVIGGERLSGGR